MKDWLKHEFPFTNAILVTVALFMVAIYPAPFNYVVLGVQIGLLLARIAVGQTLPPLHRVDD